MELLSSHTRNLQCLCAALAALTMGITAASGAVIISKTFDGVANDTGPTWSGGGWGNGSTSNANTGVVSVTAGANNYRANLNTSSSVDVSTASSFTVTWNISAGTNLVTASNAGVWHGGLFFGVTSSTATGFETAPFAFGVNLVKGTEPAGWVVVDDNNSGSNLYNRYALSGTAPTQASMEDGFTLSITLNSDNSYQVTTTGLSNTSTSTGSLLGNKATFSNLAPSLFAYTSSGGGGQSYTVDSVTLTTVIPEPSTLALLALGSLCLLVRRRRA